MKKTAIILFMSFMTILVSCKKNSDKALETDSQSEFTILKEQLVALNATLPKNDEVVTKAKWWKYLLVAAADAGGFFLGGGVSAGAGAVSAACSVSTLVWGLIKEERKQETKTVIGDVPVLNFNDSDIALTCVEGAGLVHNRVILDLYEEKGEELFIYDEKTLLPLVAEKVAIETNCTLDEATLSVQEQRNIVNKTVEAYFNASTIEGFIDNLELETLERAALSDIVNVILTGFESIDAIADNGSYSLAVQSIISESGISNDAKQILNSTTSVANASARLWKVE
ncbi:MAG: hypothetical protein IJ714_02605 [Bacteroidales bacterium]|nr:hypothetical protein [Bacteroidales bacterium]